MIDPRIAAAFKTEFGWELEPHLVGLCRMGSHSHGTYIPPTEPGAIDDVDYMGFVVPPLQFHLGLEKWEHWVFRFEELDVVLYSLEKAFNLLLKSNPNIIGALWLTKENYVHRTPALDEMIRQRVLFASRLAGESFAGYAHDQLSKMTSFSLDKLEAYEAHVQSLEQVGVDPNDVIQADYARLNYLVNSKQLSLPFLEAFRKLHKQHFAGYMGPKRKSLVRRFGYDCKNAAHLIRLLRMGIEFLKTGTLQVYRVHDHEQLKAIKRGEWTLEQVQAEATLLFGVLEKARKDTWLPVEADTKAADKLLQTLQQRVLGLVQV